MSAIFFGWTHTSGATPVSHKSLLLSCVRFKAPVRSGKFDTGYVGEPGPISAFIPAASRGAADATCELIHSGREEDEDANGAPLPLLNLFSCPLCSS